MCIFAFLRRLWLFIWTPESLFYILTLGVRFWTLISLLFGLGDMSSMKFCCVRGCTTSRSRSKDREILHSFPDPDKDGDRFRVWVYAIGGNLFVLDSQYVFKNRKVCHKHFESRYHTGSARLSANAVPTLALKGSSGTDDTNVINNDLMVVAPSTSAGSSGTGVLSDITNVINNDPMVAARSTSAGSSGTGVLSDNTNVISNDPMVAAPSTSASPSHSLKTMTKAKDPPSCARTGMIMLQRKIKKLQAKKDNYATRLKNALKLSENATFQKCLQKFTTLAALFTVMQFREISKPKMGRRFTKQEKIMALSLYKQGPKAYRWLSKMFILPSPVTLSRLVSRAGLKPGINKKIFTQLKKRVESMTETEKLCILLFDEMSITPHFDVSRKRDLITGFVNNGKEVKRMIADHALVFMLRGVVKNYKQPLAYTFCKGTTRKEDLKIMIKNIIAELQSCGLNVIATVCDQGTSNVSTINKLIEETRQEYVKRNEEFKHPSIFEVNGEEIIPLYDPPHLIKGIRNNLISKNLKCVLGNKIKIAEWDHIIKLHDENPAYKGIRLIKNLTEAHVDPKKIPKMKVKMATQIFSKTVATNMGYLADQGILPEKCKDTADVLLFFDELFDSMNGNRDNSKKRSGKILLRAVTPKSYHFMVWANAKTVLKSMKFVTINGRESSVPSVHNWLRTLENIEILINKLFNQYQVKSIWMRHFNQDPLENFFGCIRSHGCRNISPTPFAFESAFSSLLINNISSNHSVGSNCEKDDCMIFQSMDYLLRLHPTKSAKIANNK